MNPTTGYEDPGRWSSLLLTVLMHGVLALALVVSVRWQTRHEPVAVELWAPPPPVAETSPPTPPPTPEPPRPAVEPAPPPPPKPQIALKDPRPKPAPKPEKAPPAPNFDNLLARETQKLDRLKEERDRQARAEQEAAMLARAQADAQAQAQRSARERAQADYVGRLQGKIRGNLVQPPNLKGNPSARFLVTQLPNGEILDVRLKKPSGNPLYDDAIERAIRRSSPLPLPEDRSLFARDLEILYCPEPGQGGRCPP